VKVTIEETGEVKLLRFEGAVGELLKKLGVNPEAVIVARNGEQLTASDKVADFDEILIMDVVTGG